MEESSVTVDGVTHRVGRPFMVVATQNPIEQAGTYRLPEAQLDRFLMKTSLGYPDHESTIGILKDAANRDRSAGVGPLITAKAAADMAALADLVHVDAAILGYVSRIAEESRKARHVKIGLSVRGCLAYVRAAKTWAASDARRYLVPDDIKELAIPIMSHRLLLDAEAEFNGIEVESVIAQILSEVKPPVERAA
jgi:MoxR-like ATPase